jgi:iron complex outermembrane recepter protein
MHMFNRISSIWAGLLVSSMALPGMPASAQNVSAGVLEEVIVVARKREESLQETPVSVTAINNDELRAAGIQNLEDLVKAVPGMSNNEGARAAGFIIRGVGTRTADVRADPGVGVYVDSIFIPRSDTQLLDTINVESIQVLRGPQGTLFGKNTAGGAILLSTSKPGEEFEAFAELNVGDQSRIYARGGVSGPLTDTLSAGVVLNSREEDGYMTDAETDVDYGDTDRQSALLQFRWLPTEDFAADLMLFSGRQRENAHPTSCRDANNPEASLQGFTAPGESRDYLAICQYSESLAKDQKVIMDRSTPRWEVDNQLAGLTINWDMGGITLRSITGYLQQDGFRQEHDADASPLFTLQNRQLVIDQLLANGIDDADQEERSFISQEFNLMGTAFEDSLEYTVGVYMSREHLENSPGGHLIGPGGYLGLDLGGPVVALPPAVAGFRRAELAEYENDAEAAFFQGTWHFNEQWQLTIGGRYTQEEKTAEQRNFIAAPSDGQTLSREEFDALENEIQTVIPDSSLPYFKDSDSWDNFSPSISLSMMAPQSWLSDTGLNSGMFYLSASEGFKAGGIELFGTEPVAFDPETVLSYEFGFKLDMLAQRLRLNGAIYHSKYDDIQLKVTRRLGELETDSGITNAAKSTIRGGELELTALPVEGLTLRATASYVNAEYDEFVDLLEKDTGLELVDRSGEDFPFLPEQTYSWLIQYDWGSDIGLVTPRLSGYYKDSIFIGADHEAAANSASYLDSYTIWDARVAYVPTALPGLEFAAYAKNLTDEFYYVGGFIEVGSVGSAALVVGRPRSYGVEVFYRW